MRQMFFTGPPISEDLKQLEKQSIYRRATNDRKIQPATSMAILRAFKASRIATSASSRA